MEDNLDKLSEAVVEMARMEERLFWMVVTGAVGLAFVFYSGRIFKTLPDRQVIQLSIRSFVISIVMSSVVCQSVEKERKHYGLCQNKYG